MRTIPSFPVDLGIMDISNMLTDFGIGLLEIIAEDGWEISIKVRGKKVYAVLRERMDWTRISRRP